jgi:hypothetical protein
MILTPYPQHTNKYLNRDGRKEDSMGLSDIAAGVEVTTKQDDRGIATVDATDVPLIDRLAEFADALPCSTEEAATLVEAYATGASVGQSSCVAGLVPITGAKTLHLLGEPIAPITPVGRELVRDWLNAECTRADALALSGASETEFALAAFIETHDPIPGTREALEEMFMLDSNPTVSKRDALAETMSDAGDLF